jgi:hypothetical protein
MKLLVSFLALAGLAWLVANKLSSDAISMAIGIMLGVIVCTPVLLVAFLNKRTERHDITQEPDKYAFKPPVVILQGPPVNNYYYNDHRTMSMIDGEYEELIDAQIVRR